MLSSVEGYRHEKVHPDIFLVTENEPLWRRKYLHPSYEARKKLEFVQGRCWDIYNFPLFTEAFCSSLVAEAENFGQWSGGTYNDKRLKGGYEPVPTRDIHFKQMGFDKAWYVCWVGRRILCQLPKFTVIRRTNQFLLGMLF